MRKLAKAAHFVELASQKIQNRIDRETSKKNSAKILPLHQPRSQALSSMRRCGGKTLAGAGHVIDQILIA